MGSSSPWKGAHTPVFGPCLLWPNGRPSQLLQYCWAIVNTLYNFEVFAILTLQTTEKRWRGGRPRPRPHLLDGDPAPPSKIRGTASPHWTLTFATLETSKMALSRSKLHQIGRPSGGNWHVNCQHSSYVDSALHLCVYWCVSAFAIALGLVSSVDMLSDWLERTSVQWRMFLASGT